MKVRGIRLPLSKSCRDVNPQLADKTQLQGRSRTRVGLRCGMNKIEAEYAFILESMRRRDEILRWDFEGITLRFANVKYTPDFVVLTKPSINPIHATATYDTFPVRFIEVKGPFIRGNRERAIERFRHAKTYWPEFAFEMWQKKDGQWTQII